MFKLSQDLLQGRLPHLMPILRWQSSGLNTTASPEVKNTQRAARPYCEIPGPKGIYRWPWLGARLNFKPFTPFAREDVGLLLKSLYQRYGPLFHVQLQNEMVVAVDPRDIETVFRNEGKFPYRLTFNVNQKVLTEGRVFPDLKEEWIRLRLPLNKRLGRVDSATQFLPAQGILADEFVDILARENFQADELYHLFLLFMADNIGIVLFNKRPGFMDSRNSGGCEMDDILESNRDIFQGTQRCFTGMLMPEALPHFQKYQKAIKNMWMYVTNRVEDAKKDLEMSKDKTVSEGDPSLLSSFLSDPQLSFEEVASLVLVIFTAAIDSAAGTLQGLFYNLAKNPEKQEILSTEILDVVGNEKTVTKEHLSRMPYLKACVQESLRMVFPVINMARILPTSVVLSGYEVPAGIPILMANNVSSEVYFTNSDQFLPERWIRSADGTRNEDIHKMAALPFGHGPRNCIGRRLAEQELFLTTIKVLQRLRIEADVNTNQRLYEHMIFVRPKKPFKFTFLERK